MQKTDHLPGNKLMKERNYSAKKNKKRLDSVLRKNIVN
jgi:hypothetical protein